MDDLEVINYDELASEYNKLPKRQGHFLAPQWPFFMVVVGPTGCGKSNVALDLIFKRLYYDRLYMYAKKPQEDKMELVREFIEDVCEKKNEQDPDHPTDIDEMLFIGGPDDIKDPSDYDKEFQNLVVFDDMVAERHQERIEETFVRGRGNNCSCIYMTQTWGPMIPKVIRDQCNYVAVFGISDDDAMRIRRSHGMRLSKDEFLKVFHEATDARHSFLLIDLKTPHLPLAFRKGWNGLLDPSAVKGR